ncbi:MAG TPA: DUF2231 domain-containing protein [Nitrospirota bacterium]
MESKVSIGKHPIHPMLVSFPIAFFTFSLVCDFLFYGNAGSAPYNWLTFSNLLIGAGIITALAAAVAGFIDLLNLPAGSRARRLGYWHMGLNLTVVTMFAVNLSLRTLATGNTAPIAEALSSAGVWLLVVSGWLGGSMVFEEGVGVEAKAERRGTAAPVMPGKEEERPKFPKAA